ncbi:MAG: metallophosphoesterase [Anaerolineales bacterium]
MHIVHLSDLHIGKSDNEQKVDQITTWLVDHPSISNQDVILITGDVVDDGLLWQYEIAKGYVERLREAGFCVLCVPGNHDYGPFGITESRRSVRYFREYLSGDVVYPHLEVISGQAFILLDSMEQEMEDIEFWGAQGELGEDQLARLDQTLKNVEDDPGVENIILALHHHPFQTEFSSQLRDADAFLEVISGDGKGTSRVDCLLFGHKHVELRFNRPPEDKESQLGIDLIYNGGSTVERNQEGDMIVPVIDIREMEIRRYKVR